MSASEWAPFGNATQGEFALKIIGGKRVYVPSSKLPSSGPISPAAIQEITAPPSSGRRQSRHSTWQPRRPGVGSGRASAADLLSQSSSRPFGTKPVLPPIGGSASPTQASDPGAPELAAAAASTASAGSDGTRTATTSRGLLHQQLQRNRAVALSGFKKSIPRLDRDKHGGIDTDDILKAVRQSRLVVDGGLFKTVLRSFGRSGSVNFLEFQEFLSSTLDEIEPPSTAADAAGDGLEGGASAPGSAPVFQQALTRDYAAVVDGIFRTSAHSRPEDGRATGPSPPLAPSPARGSQGPTPRDPPRPDVGSGSGSGCELGQTHDSFGRTLDDAINVAPPRDLLLDKGSDADGRRRSSHLVYHHDSQQPGDPDPNAALESSPPPNPQVDPLADSMAWIERFGTLQRACHSIADDDGYTEINGLARVISNYNVVYTLDLPLPDIGRLLERAEDDEGYVHVPSFLQQLSARLELT